MSLSATAAPTHVASAEPFPFSKAMKDRNGLPGRDWPLNVQIQTHSICNASCVICPYPDSWNDRHRGRMDDSLFAALLDDLSQYQLGKFCLYLQNEPFIDARWFEWAEQAIARLQFQRFEVSSNLTPLTTRNVGRLADLLADVPHEIWISFHGVDKESYEQTMGLSFERALRNLRDFVRIAQAKNLCFRVHGFGAPRMPGKSDGFLFSKADYNRFLQEFAQENGLAPLPVRYFQYHDRAGQVQNPMHRFGFHRPDLTGFYCHRIDTWLHIRCNGDVISCCHDYSRATVLGNMADQDVESFFRSSRYRQHRDQALGLLPSPDNFICRRCMFPGG